MVSNQVATSAASSSFSTLAEASGDAAISVPFVEGLRLNFTNGLLNAVGDELPSGVDSAPGSVANADTVMALAQAVADPLPGPMERTDGRMSAEKEATIAEQGETSRSGSYPIRNNLLDIDPEDWQFEPEDTLEEVYVPLSSFRKLNEQRLELSGTRVMLRERRRVLAVRRKAIADRHAEYLQDLRSSLAGRREDAIDYLSKKYSVLEKLQENIQSEEDEYDLLEGSLIDQEWALRQAEAHLYQEPFGTVPFLSQMQLPSRQVQIIASSTRSASASSTLSSQIDLNSYQESSSPAPAQLIRAQLHTLEAEHRQLLEEEQMRDAVGLSLDEDSSFALRTFHIRQAELVEHLALHERNLAQRKEILDGSEELLFPVHQFTGYDLESLRRTHTLNDFYELPADFRDENDALDGMQRDTLLLPEGDRTPIFTGSSAVSMDNPDGLAYINDWLLNFFRCSFLEVLRFKTTLESYHLPKNGMIRGEWVLAFWHRDESSTWYFQSVEQAAESYEPTFRSKNNTTRNHLAESDPIVLHRLRLPHELEHRRNLSAGNLDVS